MRIAASLALALLLAPVSAHAQPPAPMPAPAPRPSMPVPGRDGEQPAQKTGTARLSGRVTAADTGRPLRRALVRALSPETPEGRSVSTDADGRWEMKSLPAARYTLQISKGGYVNLAYGQKRPFEGGTGLELAEGQAMEKLDVALPRAGVITGTVADEFGEPVSGARVTAMRNRYVGGQRRLVPMGPGDMTDDIGQYRLHGLAPGEYYVSAAMTGGLMLGQSDDRVGYAPTFHPGTAAEAEAQRVAVSEGQEARQVNISLTPTRVATITGRAVDSSGRPIAAGMLMLTTVGAGGMGFTASGARLRPDGSFTLSNVAPGDYRLLAQHMPTPGDVAAAAGGGPSVLQPEFASVPLTVTGDDIAGLELVTTTGGIAKGRVDFEGGSKPSTPLAGVMIAAPPLEMVPMLTGGSARLRDDLTFEVAGLSDRRRLSVGNLPAGWYLKSVTHEGRDVTDSGLEFKPGEQVTGIEILLTQRATELAGSVQDARARPVADYAIVAYSPDRSRWGFQSRHVRSIRPNQDGRFSLKGLPPDDYLVVALDYLEPGEETDPEQLERWRPHATAVTLREGDSKTVTLKLTQ